MSWLPSFLNWKIAGLAALISIPALLALYFLKLRRREIPVSSTILWKKAIQDLQVNAPFQKLRRNLLLFLQLTILALLLLALAKPVANFHHVAGPTTVILVDRSASMAAKDTGGRSRLDEAKRRARELVDSMPKNASAMVIAFDDSPEMIQPWTSDTTALRTTIDNIKQSDRKTRLKLAYQLAEAKLFFIPEQNRSNVAPPDVRVFSDGRVEDANELSIKSPVTLERVGDEKAGNIAIVALSAKRNYDRPTQVQVFARLANFGPEPVSSSVQLSVDGQAAQTGGSNQVFLLPERWSEDQRQAFANKEGNRKPTSGVEFTLDLPEAAVVKVEHTNRENDLLAADDTAQVVVPPPKQLSVLIVTDGNPYLERVIRAQKQLVRIDVMNPQSYEEKLPRDYDLYIYDRYKVKSLPEAGTFIHIDAVPDGLKVKAVRDANGAPVMVDYATDVASVLDWDRDHPILRGWSFNRLYVAQAMKLEVPLESQVLIDGYKGPLMALHREGRNTHVLIAFDLLNSTWPLMPSNFAAVWYNMLEYLALSSDINVRESFEPGATPRIPRTALMKGAEPLKQITLVDPAGAKTELKVPEAGDFALPPLEHVGIYKTEPAVPQFEKLAVNLLDSNESNLMPATRAPGGTANEVSAGSAKTRRDLWRYLVMAGIAMLFVEWWVYTRRVHL